MTFLARSLTLALVAFATPAAAIQQGMTQERFSVSAADLSRLASEADANRTEFGAFGDNRPSEGLSFASLYSRTTDARDSTQALDSRNLVVEAAIGERLKYTFVGHSLVDGMITQFRGVAGAEYGMVRRQSIPGMPIKGNWEHGNRIDDRNGYDVNALADLEKGDTDVLILTERADILNLCEDETREYLQTWRAQALAYNPEIEVFWYWVWGAIPNYPAAPDWAAWIAQTENEVRDGYVVCHQYIAKDIYPDAPIRAIPAGEALIALYHAVENGEVDGLSDFADIWSDDIHLSEIGGYFVSLVHWAAIHQASPVGRPWRVSTNMWEIKLVRGLTEKMAADMQVIAWNVVRNHAYTGVAQ